MDKSTDMMVMPKNNSLHNTNHEYEMGLRDGKIESLEKAVGKISEDLNKFKIAIYMLYGAIFLVQFLPSLRGFLIHANVQ